jgi:hypothetical protein
MKKLLTAGLLGLSLSFGALAAGPALAEAEGVALTVAETPIADIAATPEGKAILEKDIPGLTTHEAYDQFKGMSLKQVQPMSQGAITDAMITAVQADLDKLNEMNGEPK